MERSTHPGYFRVAGVFSCAVSVAELPSSCPVQRLTGCGGYFGNRLSDCDNRQSRKLEPVPETIWRTCEQAWHSDSIKSDPARLRPTHGRSLRAQSRYGLRWDCSTRGNLPHTAVGSPPTNRAAQQSPLRKHRRYSWFHLASSIVAHFSRAIHAVGKVRNQPECADPPRISKFARNTLLLSHPALWDVDLVDKHFMASTFLNGRNCLDPEPN